MAKKDEVIEIDMCFTAPRSEYKAATTIISRAILDNYLLPCKSDKPIPDQTEAQKFIEKKVATFIKRGTTNSIVKLFDVKLGRVTCFLSLDETHSKKHFRAEVLYLMH